MIPKHGGLYLHIDAEFERECDALAHKYGHTHCYTCNNTGRVTRRLVGTIPVEYGLEQGGLYELSYMWFAVEFYGDDNDGNPRYIRFDKDSPEDLADAIIAAYRDGTLPPALAAGLEERDA